MDWRLGYTSKYYATIVDPDTWKDRERIEIIGGSINRSLDNLMESADISCENYNKTNEQWIRIWLDAKQNGDSTHIPLFTGIATSPNKEINGVHTSGTLQCHSVLQPANDILLPRGWYAPADIDVGVIINSLLTSTNAPLTISDEPKKLTYAIVAEDGETNLSMVHRILDASNLRVKIRGNGHILICSYTDAAVATFDNLINDVIEPSISIDYNWYNCPNVFRAVFSDSYAIAIDDNPNSIFSTVNRKREVWAEETNAYLNDKETMAEYARRRLKELQNISTTIKYTRRFHPDVFVGDLIRLNYPAQNLVGSYVVASQSIELGFNCRTSEEVCMYE